MGFPGKNIGVGCHFLLQDPPKSIFVPYYFRASLVVQMVKNPPVMWEMWVQSLGWEDSLEKEMTTHSSILAWEIAWLSGLQSLGLRRVGDD